MKLYMLGFLTGAVSVPFAHATIVSIAVTMGWTGGAV